MKLTIWIVLTALLMFSAGFRFGMDHQKRYYWHPAKWGDLTMKPPPYSCSLDGYVWWKSRPDGTCYAADAPSPPTSSVTTGKSSPIIENNTGSMTITDNDK